MFVLYMQDVEIDTTTTQTVTHFCLPHYFVSVLIYLSLNLQTYTVFILDVYCE